MPTSASLEIHQINVGQGDAVLIINRNLAKVEEYLLRKGVPVPTNPIDWVPLAVHTAIKESESLPNDTVNCALLVDGGGDAYGHDVVTYLEQHGVVQKTSVVSKKFYVLVSHFHDDHMAGLRSVFKKRVEGVTSDGKKIKTVEERYRPERVYFTANDKKADPKMPGFRAFMADIGKANNPVSGDRTEVIKVLPGGYQEGTAKKLTEISLGEGAPKLPIVLKVIAAAQSVHMEGATTPTAIASQGRQADQNDRSIVLMLEYGSFRYFLGGDIGGSGVAEGGNEGSNAMNPKKKRFYSVHADVETTLAKALQGLFRATTVFKSGEPKYPWDGYCTVFKANHHGSSSSNDIFLLSTLRPLICVISAGLKLRFYGHPTQEVMNRMSKKMSPNWAQRDKKGTVPNSIDQIYVTECADKSGNKKFNVALYEARICGDIVIRPTDESVAAIHAANAPGTKLVVQVYGTGVQSQFDTKRKVALPITTDRAKTQPPIGYAVGPWFHEDTH